MPFVLRQVTPVRLSRLPPTSGNNNQELIDHDPRQYITNQTLTACLRQLASLVSLAADIFNQCQDEASAIHERTERLRERLDRLSSNVDGLDSRTVAVPEGDLAAFSNEHKSNHFKSRDCNVIQASATESTTSTQVVELKLIAPDNRPQAVVALYEKASPLVEPVVVNRPESLIEGGIDAADYGRLLELGATLRRRRKQRSKVLEIETRRPASLAHLRGWLTDDEGVLDDLASTVGPDNQRRMNAINSSDAISHRLPSPEEKARVAASQVFTAQVVQMDVTGSGFQRMTQFRRSLQQFDYAEYQQQQSTGDRHHEKARRKSKKRSSKKRRNTIACDGDRRDIQNALTLVENGHNNGALRLERNEGDKKGSRSSLRERLNLMHLLRTSLLTTPTTSKTSGTSAAVTSSDMSYDESDTMQSITTDATSHASSELVVQVTAGNFVTAHRSRSGVNTISRLRRLGTDHSFVVNSDPVSVVEVHRDNAGETEKDVELYELIPSEKEFGTLGNSRPLLRAGVKMRGLSNKENDGGRSSSGNWSASGSSCSTRASLDSDHPRHQHASPLAARQKQLAAQQHMNRIESPEMDVDSALSGDDCSATTTTTSSMSQRNHELNGGGVGGGVDHDMETSSVYSCDAEGYYTSFHIDSGLKTLKEGLAEGTAASKSHLASANGTSGNGTSSNRSSGLSSASSAIVENEYELFGKGSTLSSTTTSSAGTVIFRPTESRAASDGSATKRRNSRPPEPPPRNGSNRSSTATIASVETSESKRKSDASRELTEAESKEIADALEQLRKSTDDCKPEAPEEAEKASERILAKSQIERIPSMCAITPSPLPSDDERLTASGISSPVPPTLESAIQSAFLQHVAGSPVKAPRVNIAELPALPAATDTQIVIKASVVKCPTDQELVALSQLPVSESEASNRPFSSSAGSAESSRSSSLERKKRGARVTLDSDGKVVYSSDSLKRRKAREGHSTFEAGHDSRKLDPGTSAFRPNPIGSNEKPLSPPPYRPAPTFNGIVRTQPDGQTQQEQRSSAGSPAATALTRSDSYRMANDDLKSPVPFQRNRSDSYRRANNEEPPMRLNLLSQSVSGFAVNRASGTGQFVSGSLSDKTNRWSGSSNSSASSGNRTLTAQPMSYNVKSPMLVKQISSPGFITSQIKNGPIGRVTGPLTVNHTNGVNEQLSGFSRRISSPAMMMTSSPLLVKQPINPNVSGRRSYGGPRVLVNPKHLAGTKSGSVSSLNSSAGSGLDVSISGHAHQQKTKHNIVPPSPVVRPPSTDRPSFYNSGDLDDGSDGSPLPGYQSLSPPPKLSALPLTQLSDSAFQRNNLRYNSLPARFKRASDYYSSKETGRSSAEPIDYNKWLPGVAKKKEPTTVDTDSPDEGGFLEYNNNSNHAPAAAVAQTATSAASNSSGSSSGPNPSPTPSLSSCSLDISFTSSLNESTDQRPSWPSSHGPVTNPGMTIHSIGLVKRTSINDFKRKLLQVHQPAQRKMSAVEQLRATKPPPAGIKGPSPDCSPVPKHPAVENFVRKSPRVNYIASRLGQQQRINRFQHSPRTDVLSSTIIEGKSEEELAENEKIIEENEPKVVNGVRRTLSFQQRRTPTPSSGCSTPIETSL